MNTTELLTEPELIPILEAYFETRDAQNKALDACSWSMSLNRSWSYDHKLAETIAENIAKMTERREQLAEALILAERFADFAAAKVDELAADYETALWRYRNQQQDIANAPLRAWKMAYNARLSELDKQIKGAKIRRGKIWSKWRKDEIDYQTALTLSNALDLEIVALGVRREQVAAETFESVAA
jgi:hypothetical protein